MAKRFGLSKSKILFGLQCEKRLWRETHRRDLMETTAASELAFEQGDLRGDVARSIFGQGRLIGHVHNIRLAIEETNVALNSAKLLFEPAFSHDGVLSRADSLQKARGGWHLIEVKGSTSVKDYYLQDCAVQSWVMNSAGTRVKKVTLAHVDSAFVYGGDGDYRSLLRQVDVSAPVVELQPYVP